MDGRVYALRAGVTRRETPAAMLRAGVIAGRREL